MSKGQQMVKRIVENYMLKDKKSNQWVARSGKSANDIFYYFTEKRDEALKFKSQEEVDAEKERMKSMGFKTDIFEVVPESADYQKKRFKEPYYMYNESSKAIKESIRLSNEDDLYYWMLDYMEKNKGKGSTSLQFITNNGNNIIISWNMKQYNGISIDGQKMNMGEFCHHRMKGVGIQDVWEVDMNTGRFKPIKEDAPQKIVIKNAWGVEVKDYKAGDPIPAGAKFKIFNAKDTDKIEAYADSLFESISSKTHKFKPEELKVGKRVIDKVGGKEIRGKITVNHHDIYKDNPYTQDKKGSTVVTVVTDNGYSYDVDANDNGGEFILEGRIAKGYENLDADEKARHLLSHPSSKYMSDLKSENITERAIRKAVKEMLGKPDKRDPQFITDVNEEGEAPATTTANVATPELPMKLKEATKVPYLLKNAKVGDTFHDGSDLGREYKITRVTPSKVYATCVKDPNTTGEYNRNHPDYAETDPEWAKLYTIKESVGQKIIITLVRKPQNMKEVEDSIRKGYADRVKAVVDKKYNLSKSEYDKFVYNFMVHTTYLSGEGGVDPDGTVHVIEITAPGKKTIYVDPEGFDYARYVGY